MQIASKGLSDVGRKRDHNEDSFLIDDRQQLYAVADGMGGHAAGEIASDLAIKSIEDFVHASRENVDATWPFQYDTRLSTNGNCLKTALRLANQKICETIQQREELKDMGTTVVGALISSDLIATVGHVGDSRAYLIREQGIHQLTSDHSWVNEQIKLGFLSRADAVRHPFRNVVTRALGSRHEVIVDLVEKPLRSGDRVLLCSDGLNSMVDDAAILRAVTSAGDDLEKACRALIAAANDRGGEDNVTAVLIHVRP